MPRGGQQPETVIVEPTPGARAFTAAARRVDLTTREGRKLIGKLADWQKDAWTFKRSIGIVDRGSRFHGSAVSRLRFYAGVVVDQDEEPIPVEDAVDDPEIKMPASVAEAATVEWGRVTNTMGGQEQLQRKWGVLLSTIGDSWAVASANVDDPDVEDWDVYSPSALSVKGSGESTQVLLQETPGGPKRELVDPVAYRIWRQDEEWPGLADSPLRSVFGECEEYLIYARQFRAIGKSRIPAGITLIPSEIDPPRAPAPKADGTADSAQTGKPPEPTELEKMLMQHFLTPIENEGSAAAVFGAILRGKAEFLKEVRHLVIERPIDAQTIARIDNLMRRIADGIDLPPDLILGLADANHWTGWLIEDSTYKAHIQPLAMIPAMGMTTAFLRPTLRNPEAHPEISDADRREWLPRIVIGIDSTALVARPNRAADATAVFHEGGLSWAAWRKHLGFTEADGPDEVELAMRAKYGFTPRAAAAAIASTEAATPGDLPAEGGGDALPAGGAPARAIETTGRPLTALHAASTVARGRGAGLGSRFYRIEARLRERLVAEASNAMNDALRRAGGRLRSALQGDETLRASVAGVAAEDIGRTLGLTAASGIVNPDELLTGAFDGLHDSWDSWVGTAQAQIAKLAAGHGTADPESAAAVADYEAGASGDRDRGWAVLLGAMLTLARTRLFEAEAKPAPGEFDASLAVQMGVIRDALSTVGGLTDSVPPSTGMAGGLTGGTEVGSLLSGLGLLVDGWQWVTGAPTVPFEPHSWLEGFAFTDWQDEALANTESWPSFSFYFPGDHFGCQCDTVPVIIAVDAGEDVPSAPEAQPEVA